MTSVNKKEIDKFSKMADEWWDPEGKFKPLHKFNPIRIKYIKENIIDNFKLKNILIKNNLNLKKIDGMNFNILKDEWNVSKDLSVNYIAEFKKN